MKVMVLGGAGAVATETTKDLVYNGDFEEIVIADLNVDKAKELADELTENCKKGFIPEEYVCPANSKNLKKKRIKVMEVNLQNIPETVEIFKEMDVVACGLPAAALDPAIKAIVLAGVDGLDLCGEPAIDGYFDEDLNGIAKKNGSTFVSGVGATPGITNIMARKGVSQLDKVDEILINFAAFRCLAPSPGLISTTFWEFDPATKERLIYQDGELIKVNPFDGLRKVKFHEHIGEQEVGYIPHSEVQTICKSFPDVKHVAVRGTFPPPVMRMMKACIESGIMNHDEISFYGKKTTPIDIMKDLLALLPETRENDNWGYGLVVEVKGQKDGMNKLFRYHNEHPNQDEWGGKSTYYKNVGIPLAVGAEILAKMKDKEKKKGIFPPELFFEPDTFFEKLKARRIVIKEDIIDVD